ncbi:hypothetical protein AgCh_025350 [Apium graveolens]
MAPEMIKRKSYSMKVDVYGFGFILWELVDGGIPYEDMTPIQTAFVVVNKGLFSRRLPEVATSFKCFVLNMPPETQSTCFLMSW